MKKPEPCASANLGWPPPSGKLGIPCSRENRSNGGRLKNGGRLCSCPLSCELMSSEFVSLTFARTEITAGLTLWTIAAKLGGPDRSAGCAGASGGAARARPAAAIAPAIAAADAINAKRRSRGVRRDWSELVMRMNILHLLRDRNQTERIGDRRPRPDCATRLDSELQMQRDRVFSGLSRLMRGREAERTHKL